MMKSLKSFQKKKQLRFSHFWPWRTTKPSSSFLFQIITFVSREEGGGGIQASKIGSETTSSMIDWLHGGLSETLSVHFIYKGGVEI